MKQQFSGHTKPFVPTSGVMDLPDIKELKENHLIDEHSLRVDVIVHRGNNLAQSYWRMITSFGLDLTLDPYVRLSVTKPARHFELFAEEVTTAKDDEPNPEWEEEFSFIVDAADGPRGNLVVSVWDDNYGPDTRYSEDVAINLDDLKIGGPFRKRNLDLGSGAFIEISLRIRMMRLDVRLSHRLHSREAHTVHSRKRNCAKAISKLLERKLSTRKAPVVSIVGSGGGFRAMTGMCGVTQGLRETALLDCCTYFSTLSGSTWYLSHLYTTDGGPDVYKCGKFLKERCAEMEKIMHITRADDYVHEIYKRYLDGLNISLVDLWECYLSSIFEPDKKSLGGGKKISHQRPRVETADLPFPIYTAVNIRENFDTHIFAEWIEFTPYEYGITNYGCFYKIEDLAGNKCRGVVCRKYKELDQTFFIALWGSAFAASVQVIAHNTLHRNKKNLIRTLLSKLIEATGCETLRPFAALLPNMFYGLNLPPMLYQIVHTIETAFTAFPLAVAGVLRESHHNVGMAKEGMKKRAGPQLTRNSKRPTASKRNEMLDDTMVVVDGGLAFNLPFPPLLRPERPTDVFIVFDFSWRDTQTEYPFGEYEKAVSWAKMHTFKLPSVGPNQFDKDNLKEYYVFEDEDDPDCPIVIFFPLCNVSRKETTIHGQDETYANVNPFDECYGTTHFALSEEEFDRLKELTRYNVQQGFTAIKHAIEKKIQ